MKKITLLLISLFAFSQFNAQVVINQPKHSVNTNGIVSSYLNDTSLGTYAAENFSLANETLIEEITVYGFTSDNNVITGLDVYIYNEVGGLPSSDPSNLGTGLLEIVNFDPTNAAITMVESDITIDISAANGSDLILPAGDYWFIVAPRMPTNSLRWNWFNSESTDLQDALLFDQGNFGGFDYTLFSALGVTTLGSLAFMITGDETLSIDELAVYNFTFGPNPVNDILTLKSQENITNVSIVNLLGQEVIKVTPNTLNAKIDLSNIESGAYFIKVQINDKIGTFKIIKK